MLRVFGLLWARTVATQAKYKHVVELDFSKVDYMNNEVCNLFFSISKFFIPNYSFYLHANQHAQFYIGWMFIVPVIVRNLGIQARHSQYFRCTGTPQCFSAIFTKGSNFYGFQVAFLDSAVLSK